MSLFSRARSPAPAPAPAPGITLAAVLQEYREKHQPWAKIDSRDVDTTIGFLAGLSMPAVKGAPRTEQQKEYEKAARTLRKCRRLIASIEQHQRI